MYDALQETTSGVTRFCLREGDAALTVVDVLVKLRDDPAFGVFFNQLLADSPFSAFRWETPAITASLFGRPFEFVLQDYPALDRPADSSAFAEHFDGLAQARGVASFPNLRGDASMIVPCAFGKVSCYGHLAAFVRGAPDDQRSALWQLVGQTMLEKVGRQPIWLNTAGMGVSWLHVRLDSRPKYYGHRPYKDAGFLLDT